MIWTKVRKKHTHRKKFFQSSFQHFLKMRVSYDIIKPSSLYYNPGLLTKHVWMFKVATKQSFVARLDLNMQCQCEVSN